MGFIKDVGPIAGKVAGLVVGAPIAIVGEAVDSDFLKEVGDGVFKASSHTGDCLAMPLRGLRKQFMGQLQKIKQCSQTALTRSWTAG